LLFDFLIFCLKTLLLLIAKCVYVPLRSESKHGCWQRGLGRGSGVEGEQVEAHALERNSTLCSHFKCVFKQIMLKNAYFFRKTVNIVSASVCLRRLGTPLPESRVVTSAYYYNFVGFVSIVLNAFYTAQKRTK